MEAEKQELQEPYLSAEIPNQQKVQKEHDQKQIEKSQEQTQDQDLVQVQDPKAGFGAIPDMDGEDFIFSDEAFASLPDFRCLSSPSSSPSPSPASHVAKNLPACTAATSCPSSSSSSSSPPSPDWPFLRVPDGFHGSGSTDQMIEQKQPDPGQPTELQLDMDLLGNVDLFDLSAPWDPASLFPDDLNVDEPGACSTEPFNLDLSCAKFEGTANKGATQRVEKEEEQEEEDEDLGSFFLEWLKNNKDAISPEDLRTIRLKKSTIDCAARRLGEGRNGRMQLLKLILSWVQNHHLQKKRKRCKEKTEEPCMAASENPLPLTNPQSLNPNPNPNSNIELDMAGTVNLCNSWFPHTDMYNFPQSCTTTSVVVNSQPISPVSDFRADPSLPWTQNYNLPFHGFPSLASSVQPTQYGTTDSMNTLYHQQMSGIASATREARKKRMARQRRLSSLHQNRALTHGGNQVLHAANSNRYNMTFWSSYSSNSQQGKGVMDLCLPPYGTNMPVSQVKPTLQGSSQQERNIFRSGVSGSDRRHMQLMKPHEKNLRFLLQKVLKQSDVGSLGRIVLPKKEAEIHLPELGSRDGITLPMEDITTSCVWNMRYRFWPNNKSRMYLLENTGDFVRANGLEEGDFIVIYSDVMSGKYMIRGAKIRQAQEKGADQVQEKHANNLGNNCEENASFSVSSRQRSG